MPLVISDQAVDIINHEIVINTVSDPDGKERKITEAKELDRVHLTSGVQASVPEWVLENEHFKILVADGKASAIA